MYPPCKTKALSNILNEIRCPPQDQKQYAISSTAHEISLIEINVTHQWYLEIFHGGELCWHHPSLYGGISESNHNQSEVVKMVNQSPLPPGASSEGIGQKRYSRVLYNYVILL